MFHNIKIKKIKRLVNPKKRHTFATHKELEDHYPVKSEKGIRCESGTIPVAVYPDFHLGV